MTEQERFEAFIEELSKLCDKINGEEIKLWKIVN